MNKGIIFALGVLTGAAGGSVATYFIVNKQRDEEMDAYAEHCEERIERVKRKVKEDTLSKKPEQDEVPLTDDPNEDAINRNAGVKKYHHSDGLSSKYGANHVFGKDDKPKKTNQKLITEIYEDDFLNEENGYAKETIDILLGDDSDIVAFWGYNTDNEEFVEKKFNKGLKDLIGKEYVDYEYLLHISDEEDNVGSIYIRNDNIMSDFEVIIHDMREEDK